MSRPLLVLVLVSLAGLMGPLGLAGQEVEEILSFDVTIEVRSAAAAPPEVAGGDGGGGGW